MIEWFRKALRSILGYDAWLYRKGSRVIAWSQVILREGPGTARQLWKLSKFSSQANAFQRIRLKSLLEPITLRPGTSDMDTVIDNVIREEYGQFKTRSEPRWMIDAGAYIGDTAAYFLSRFPQLNVIALEPNPPSYGLARMNLEPYGARAHLLQKGLSHADVALQFGGDSTGAGFRTDGLTVECTSIASLMKRYELEWVDIVKIDIEGAEVAIFESEPEKWLGRVGMVQIELHGERAEKLIPPILRENGFSVRQYRSVWYCTRDS